MRENFSSDLCVAECIRRWAGEERLAGQCLLALANEGRLSMGDVQLVRDLVCYSGEQDEDGAWILLAALVCAEAEGSLCLDLDAASLARYLPAAEKGLLGQAALEAVGDYWKNCQKRKVNALVSLVSSINKTPETPLVADPSRGRVGFVWWQRLYLAERALEAAFQKRRAGSPKQLDKGLIENVISRAVAFEKMALNPEQAEAVRQALEAMTLVISGGPGTGKTTTVAAVLRALLAAGECLPQRVALAAPTGRAAQRMKDSLVQQTGRMTGLTEAEKCFFASLEGKTIQRLLEYDQGNRKFRRNSFWPLDTDVVVIDEVSMVAAELMVQLVAAIPTGCRLILLGDRDQLPSVDAGAILADILPASSGKASQSSGVVAVTLRENNRSVKKISAAAEACNLGQADEFFRLVPLIQAGEARQILSRTEPPAVGTSLAGGFRAWITDWLAESFGQADCKTSCLGLVREAKKASAEILPKLALQILSLHEGARILALVRRGMYGVEGLNRIASRWFEAALLPQTGVNEKKSYKKSGELSHGIPLIITVNDYRLGLFNGDTGVVLRGQAWFRDGGGSGVRSFPLAELGSHQAAFAITVHKSQGSEYDRVLLVFPDAPGSKLLVRQIVYTGLTRAKNEVIVYGREAIIRTAIGQSIERRSGLQLY